MVFISYATEDRELARKLAELLIGGGRSVWWDRNIPVGKRFDLVIADALQQARCVVVLWTQHSVASDWVKEEASVAAGRDILVPALLENIPIPLGFGRIQTASLIGWAGSATDPGYRSLEASVDQLLKMQDMTRAPPVPPTPTPNARLAPTPMRTAAKEIYTVLIVLMVIAVGVLLLRLLGIA
jgi:hypothetical protein